MIFLQVCPEEAKQPFTANGALALGQWVYVSGFDATYNNRPIVRAVVTSVTGYQHGTLFPIMRYPVSDEEWQDMNEAGYTCAANDKVIGLIGPGIVIEDHDLYTTLGYTAASGAFDVAGTRLMVNASGFLVRHDGGAAPVVAISVSVDHAAKICVYQTV